MLVEKTENQHTSSQAQIFNFSKCTVSMKDVLKLGDWAYMGGVAFGPGRERQLEGTALSRCDSICTVLFTHCTGNTGL